MAEKLGVIEAIEQTAEIVDSYKEGILEDARIFSSKVSQSATPETISGYRKVIGTPKHFQDIKDAAEELDQTFSPSSKEYFFDIATFIEIYQYLYLINDKENPAEVYTGRDEAIRISTRNILSHIEKSLEHWEKRRRSDGLTGLPDPEGIVSPSINLLCMCYFPKEDISEIEDKIEDTLKGQNIDPKLLDALSKFPSQFNSRTAHYDRNSRLDFFYTYTHEFSHAYIIEKTPKKNPVFNEATAQFISRYLEAAGFDKEASPSNSRLKGIKFENSQEKYSAYDDWIHSSASEEIYIITEFMKLKSMEKIRSLDMDESNTFDLVEWLIMEEIRAINKCKEENNGISKEGILSYYIPIELREEVRKINETIEYELNPLINEIKELLEELDNYKEFHYRKWTGKINEILKNAVNQEMSESEFKSHLEEEAEQKSKLHGIERILDNDLKRLQIISQKDRIGLGKIVEIVEELPEEPDPSKELEKIKREVRPGENELEELKEDLKDLENLKSKIEEVKYKDKEEISAITHKGYEVNIRKLEEEEIRAVNELISQLEKLEQECGQIRKDIKEIIQKSGR